MLKRKYYTGEQIHDVICKCLDDYDTILKMLEEFAKLPSAERWIPCSERLPDKGEAEAKLP